jgi:hypothetical protein
MTQVLLCAGPNLLVIRKDGLLFFRRPGQPDAPVPYAPVHYPVFLRSAREKHDMTPVVGPSGEECPCLSEDSTFPTLHPEFLETGELVYRLPAGAVATAEQDDPGMDVFPGREPWPRETTRPS